MFANVTDFVRRISPQDTKAVRRHQLAILRKPNVAAHFREVLALQEGPRVSPQLPLRTLLVVDVRGRADEPEHLSFGVAQDHGLLEVAAIDSVLGAKRSGLEGEPLSRTHPVPQGRDRHLSILGVNRAHPGFRMRADEVEGLTGEFEPHLIDEIRRPIRLERPGRHGKLLQQADLKFQIGVEGGILQ